MATKKSGPGKSFRKGTTLIEAVQEFSRRGQSRSVVCVPPLGRWNSLSLLRRRQCIPTHQWAQDASLSL